MERFGLKECYVRLEPLENLLSTNDAASLAFFTKDSDSTIQTIRKFLISKVNFRRETQQNLKNHSTMDNVALSSAFKPQKLHICHICFQSFTLNCDLRDHVFFAHTAHPTLQETLKVNIVGSELSNDLDYNEILLGGYKKGTLSLVSQEVSGPEDFGPDSVRKSGRKPVKNRRYDDYLAPSKTSKNALSPTIKDEFVATSPTDDEVTSQSPLSYLPHITNHADFGRGHADSNFNDTAISHYTKSEPLESTQNSCNICGKLFIKRLHLKRHFDSVHLRLRPHLCFECGEKFASKDTLAQHIRTIHEKSRPFICTLCPGPNGKAFTRKQCLTTHIRVAHKDLILRQNNPNIEVIIIDPFNPDNPSPILIPAPSTESSVDASQLSDVITHAEQRERKNATFTGGKIKLRYYRCHFCGKIFNQEAHLSRHIKSVHERLKPYKCYLCAKIPIGPGTFTDIDSRTRESNYMIKSFSRKEFLIKHIRSVHQGYRGYQCEDCGMKYCDKRDMENHRKKAHSAFQNPGATRHCPYEGCGKVFTSRIHLSKHLKKFHPNHKSSLTLHGIVDGKESSAPLHNQNELEALMLNMNHEDNRGEGGLHDPLVRYGQMRDNGNVSYIDGIMATTPVGGVLGEERPAHGGDPLNNYNGIISDMDHILTDITFDTMNGNKIMDASMVATNSQFSDMFDPDGVTESDSPDAVFMCESCDKGFINRASLIRHFKSVHENHRAYTCHICSRSFNQKPHLERHLSSLIHADILKYPCDYCNKRFALKSQLEKHLFDLNYHRDPNYVRVPKYVCYICTPPEALAIGNELDFVADGEDPYATIASSGGQTKPSMSDSVNLGFSGASHQLSMGGEASGECHSSDEENNDTNDGILRVNSTFHHMSAQHQRPAPGRPRNDADDRLLATLTSTLDEGRINYESAITVSNSTAGISAVPAEPGSIRDQLHHIRQSSIVRFGRKKDLIKHLKEVHYGHIAFNQLGLASTHTDPQPCGGGGSINGPGNPQLLVQQAPDPSPTSQIDNSPLIATSAYDAGQLTAILLREQQHGEERQHGPISSEDELAQYCNELESAAAASDRLNAASTTSNYLITDALTHDQNKMVAAVMGNLSSNANVYDVVNNFVLINGSTGIATRVEGTDLVDVCDADAQQQLRCAIEEHARRTAQESVLERISYEDHRSVYSLDNPMAVASHENERAVNATDEVIKTHHPGISNLIIRNAVGINPGTLQISSGPNQGISSNCGGNTNSLIMSNLAALNNSLGAASHRAHLNTLQQQFSLNVSPGSISHLLNTDCGDLARETSLSYNVTNLDPILAASSPSAPLPIYECKVCCRTFASKVNLRRHNERIHSDLKPTHLCEFCGKVFGYARTLRDHIHSAHREECRGAASSAANFDLYDGNSINCGPTPGSDLEETGQGQSNSGHHLYNVVTGGSSHPDDDDDDEDLSAMISSSSTPHGFTLDSLEAGQHRDQQLRVIYAAAYGTGPEHDTRGTLALMDSAPSTQELEY